MLSLLAGCLPLLAGDLLAAPLSPVSAKECAVLDNLIKELDSLPPSSSESRNPGGFAARPRLNRVAEAMEAPLDLSRWTGDLTPSDLQTFNRQTLPRASLRSCRTLLQQIRRHKGGMSGYLRESFPDGTHVSLSRVMFNNDASLACFEYSPASGPLGMEVWQLVMRREDERHWRLIGWRLSLVS